MIHQFSISLGDIHAHVICLQKKTLKDEISVDVCHLNSVYYFSLLTKMFRKICNGVFLTVFGDSVLHLFTPLLASYIIVTTGT